MIQVIDTDSSSLYYSQVTQLDGVEYVLQFIWNDRIGAWYLSLYDQSENPIALGIRLVVSWPLLRRFSDTRLPPGLLMCVDQSGQDLEIEVATDLGGRVLLMYTTADDASLA